MRAPPKRKTGQKPSEHNWRNSSYQTYTKPKTDQNTLMNTHREKERSQISSYFISPIHCFFKKEIYMARKLREWGMRLLYSQETKSRARKTSCWRPRRAKSRWAAREEDKESSGGALSLSFVVPRALGLDTLTFFWPSDEPVLQRR
jgi:hypothetical protein